MALTTIGDRITPSTPIQITFDSQTIAVGTKITTLVGHKLAGGLSLSNVIYTVTNIGDPVAAQMEVDVQAGTGSEIGQMAYAFVAANSLVGGSNFPAFQVLMLDPADTGIAADAQTALTHGRHDMIVSCYPASDTVNTGILVGIANQISGPDRDLQGQFGSFVTVGSIDSVAAVQAYTYNSKNLIIASLPDTNIAQFSQTLAGNLTQGSPTITNLVGASVIPVGATASSQGIPSGAVVVSVTATTVTLNMNSLAPANGAGITFAASGSGPSQPERIVAAAHAGGMMASAFPYNPLKGVSIGGLKPPVKMSDRVQIDPAGSSEALLKAGVSPLYVAPGNVVSFLKTVTTYHLLPDGVTQASDYTSWGALVTLNDFREELYQISQNPPFNNNPGGTKASVAVANAFLGECVRLALNFEDMGAFQGVKSLVKLFQVAPSVLRRGRFDVKLPLNVLPDLDTIAINLVSTTLYDFTI